MIGENSFIIPNNLIDAVDLSFRVFFRLLESTGRDFIYTSANHHYRQSGVVKSFVFLHYGSQKIGILTNAVTMGTV